MWATLLTVLGVCNDKESACHVWAQAGNCENNTGYMLANCPVSCGICSANCTDTHKDCVGWMNTGQCQENPTVMLKLCPVSCGICTPVCKDTHGNFVQGPSANESTCDLWKANGECTGRPLQQSSSGPWPVDPCSAPAPRDSHLSPCANSEPGLHAAALPNHVWLVPSKAEGSARIVQCVGASRRVPEQLEVHDEGVPNRVRPP